MLRRDEPQLFAGRHRQHLAQRRQHPVIDLTRDGRVIDAEEVAEKRLRCVEANVDERHEQPLGQRQREVGTGAGVALPPWPHLALGFEVHIAGRERRQELVELLRREPCEVAEVRGPAAKLLDREHGGDAGVR